MKEKQLRLGMQFECEQDWDNTPRVEGGWHCQQCSKVVMDFTAMPDEELIRIFTKKPGNKLCGRFYRHQLDKVYTFQEPASQSSNATFRLLLAGLLTLRLSSEAQTTAAQKPPLIQTDQKKTGPVIPSSHKTIKGKVFDRVTKAGVSIKIKLYADKTDSLALLSFSTDSSGHYEIELPDESLNRFFRLVYSSPDNYEERAIVIDRTHAPAYLPVSLMPVMTVEVAAERSKADEVYVPISIDRYDVTSGIPMQYITTRPAHPRWYKFKRYIRYFLRGY